MKRRKWLIQKKKGKEPDDIIIERLLRRDALIELGAVKETESPEDYGKDWIPIGDIPFIEAWLAENYHTYMAPIEVPKVLRTDEFLGRPYIFVGKEKLHEYNNSDKHFIKNVTRLKSFNNALYEGALPGMDTIPDGTYLVSGWMKILSEFRIFVHKDQILAAQNYIGKPLVFPNPEIVRNMVNTYTADPERPKAYVMDVAVIEKEDGIAQTVVLEVHPFAACGLYGFEDREIPDMLEAGIRYYTKGRRVR